MARDSISGLWAPMRRRPAASRAAHAVPTWRCETTGLDRGHCAQRAHQSGSAQVRSIHRVRQENDWPALLWLPEARAVRPGIHRQLGNASDA